MNGGFEAVNVQGILVASTAGAASVCRADLWEMLEELRSEAQADFYLHIPGVRQARGCQ